MTHHSLDLTAFRFENDSPAASDVASKLFPKCAAVVLGEWPRWSYSLHHTHIRFLNRHRIIEQHNASDYRLSPFGKQVRAALEQSK